MANVVIQLKTDAGALRNEIGPIKDDLRQAKQEAKGVGDALSKAFSGSGVASLTDRVRAATSASEQFAARLRTSAIHAELLAQKSTPLAQGFAAVATQMQRETEAATRATSVHQRLLASANPLSAGFAEVAKQLAHEKQVLNDIEAPLKNYEKMLRSLDALLEKQSISTAQYAAEVKKLNASMAEKSRGPAKMNLAGAEGMLGAIGGAAGVLGAGHVIDDAIHEAEELQDRYTELANTANKFTDKARDVNAVIAMQRQLAHDLNSTIRPTMELYDDVGDSLSELNLSQSELTRATETLGKATVLANQPLEAAGNVIGRLSVAMSDGAGAGRAMKSIIIQFPELAELWTKAFKTNKDGLIDMADSGKKSLKNFVDVLIAGNSEIDDSFKKRNLTNAQTRAQFQEDVEVLIGKGVPAMQAYAAAGNDAAAQGAVNFQRLRQGLEPLDDNTQKWNEMLLDTVKTLHRIGEEAEKAITQKAGDAFVKGADAVQKFGAGVSAFLGNDQWAEAFGVNGKGGILQMLPQGTEAAMKYSASIGEAKKQLVDLNAAHKAGIVVGEAYRQQWESLISTINGKLPETVRLLHEIRDPVTQYAASTKALNDLLRSGTITLSEYNAELTKLVAGAPETAKGVSSVDALTRRANRRAGGFTPQLDVNVDETAGSESAASGMDDRMKRAADIYNATATAAQKYRQEVAEINDLHSDVMSDEAYTNALEEIRKKYNDAQTPAEKFNEAIDDANEKLDAGIYTNAEYARKINDINDQFATGAAKGWADGIKSIKQQMDIAAQTSKLMTTTFDQLGSVITQVFTTGTADVKKAVAAMLAELAKLVIYKGIMAALTGGAGAALPIPAFASGGMIPPGGSGGTDTQVVAFRKSPDETVRVTTPQQEDQMFGSGAARGGAGGGNVNVGVYADMHQAMMTALNTPDGERFVLAVLLKNSGVLRGHLVK